MDISKLVEDLERKATSGGGSDILMESTWIEVIDRIGGFILGLLIVLLAISLPLIITLEVMYINFPAFRVEIVDKLSEKFKGNGHIQRVMKLTFHDARRALKEANTIQTGKSANLAYLFIKAKWIIIVTCSLYIYLGGIDIIIAIVFKLFSGLIDVIIGAIG